MNRATHDYPNAHRARARGWRRAWVRTPLRPVAYLSAIPDPDSEICGLIAEVPGEDWAALDAREYAYSRVSATRVVAHDRPDRPEIALYTVTMDHHGVVTEENPILLSYIDVVVQGYLREFGETGVREFFDSTTGWHAPVLDDRTAPRYPRAQRLSACETTLVDDALADHRVRIIRA